MFRNFIAALILCFVPLAPTRCLADFILGYDAQDIDGPLVPNEVGLGVVGLALSRGPGIAYAGGGSSDYNSNNWDEGSTDEYIEWGFSSTTIWNLSTFQLNSSASGTGPNSLELFASVNNGAYAQIGSAFAPGNVNGFDISALAGVSKVDFRLFGRGATSNAGTFRILDSGNYTAKGSDLVINGTIVGVPEPSSACLFSLASLMGVGLFRRHG